MNARVSATPGRIDTRDLIWGDSLLTARLRAAVDRVAPAPATVLVRGETGTGKELVARAIHERSGRSGAFVAVSCAAIPETLLESELFGHERGAFTGALQRKVGLVEAARGGTLFLDEIGDISPPAQVKLLRLLQQREFQRVGSTTTIEADVRFVAATHRDLECLVAAGRFREDLFYRLSVVPVHVPPLRERPHDIEILARRFCEVSAAECGRPTVRLSSAAIAVLRTAGWPGNVRELQNLIQRLVVLAGGDEIDASHVEASLSSLRGSRGATAEPSNEPASVDDGSTDVVTLEEAVRRAEASAITAALRRAAGNRLQAAKLLRVSRATLYNKLHEHQLL